MKKSVVSIIATASATLVAGTVFAQTAQTWIEIESDQQMVAPFEMTVDQLEEMNIVTADGETIGEVEEVLGSSDGQPGAFAVEVGGFLGIGEKDAIVTFDQVSMEGNALQVDMTTEEVEALPEWNDD